MSDLIHKIKLKKEILFIILGGTALVCWFLGSSFISLVHNKLEFKRLSRLSAQLDQEHEQLVQKLELLKKQDPVYLERVARVQYHMSAPGEKEFRFQTK